MRPVLLAHPLHRSAKVLAEGPGQATTANELASPPLRRRELLLGLMAAGLLPGCGGGGGSEPTTPAVYTPTTTAQAVVDRGLVGAAFGLVEAGAVNIGVAGLRKLGEPALVQTGDVFYFGSNGKAMTAMALARMVELGQLSWTMRLTDAVPALIDVLHADYAKVTLAELLNHKAGLPAFTGGGEAESRFQLEITNQYLKNPSALPSEIRAQRLYLARWILGQAPALTPGSAYSYSNAGYLIAAMMAEQVTGQAFEALFQQHFVSRLGLSSMEWRTVPERSPYQPTGHEGAKGQLQPVSALSAFEESWLTTMRPAGYWGCQPGDYALWIKTLLAALQGQSTVLPAAAVATLRSLSAGDYQLGWAAVSINGRTLLAHNGHIEGFMAEVVLRQDGAWGCFGQTNTGWEDASGSWVLTLLDQHLALLLGERL